VVKEFEKLNAKLIGVLGNYDGENVHLLKNFLEVNGDLKGELGEIEVDGLKVGIYHGTSKELKERLINSGEYNILVCEHTHTKEPNSDGGLLVRFTRKLQAYPVHLKKVELLSLISEPKNINSLAAT
jgi:predicted phosphodiesterase